MTGSRRRRAEDEPEDEDEEGEECDACGEGRILEDDESDYYEHCDGDKKAERYHPEHCLKCNLDALKKWMERQVDDYEGEIADFTARIKDVKDILDSAMCSTVDCPGRVSASDCADYDVYYQNFPQAAGYDAAKCLECNFAQMIKLMENEIADLEYDAGSYEKKLKAIREHRDSL